MQDSNAFVSREIRFEPALDRSADEMLRAEAGLTVVLDGDRRVRLDPADKRSAGFVQVLEGLRQRAMPVYLEIDPETSTISRLLIPHVTRVIGLKQLDEEAFEIELERSHARHVLRRDAADFEALEARIREALEIGDPIILTESDEHEILDIQDYRPGPEGPPPPFPSEQVWRPLPWPWRWFKYLWDWPWWPCWWFRCVSAAKAQQIFDDLASRSCDPLTVPAPCIPFLYPDDGCWGRAHEMCRLMIDMGRKPKKVWIQGTLRVDTKNNPSCEVRWGWHVAPTLCVRGPWFWFFRKRQMVIDPSLFTTPVTKSAWKGVQGDPNATLTDSAASVFYLWSGETDPTNTKTEQVLATYRLYLQNRANQHGPPPYAHCP